MPQRRLLILSVLLGSMLAGPPSRSAPTDGLRVPVRILGGKLVVACDVSTATRRIPVNLFVELQSPSGLRLHTQAARGIRAENRDGSSNAVTIHFPDLEIRVDRREEGPEEDYEAFTRNWSSEMAENPLVGSIGARVLARYHLVLDLAEGEIVLSSPRAAEENAAEPVEGKSVVPITTENDVIWLPVRYEDGTPAAMALGTGRTDTVIDRAVAEAKGCPAGDVGALRIGSIDVSKYVALRPEPLDLRHPDGVAGVTGLNLLGHLRVEIDRVNHVARLEESRPAAFPEDDLAFFRARVVGDADGVESWLEAYPDGRLATEAADLLLSLRLAGDAEPGTLRRALTRVRDSRPEDLRATTMLERMEDFAKEGRTEPLLAAGELGIECGREDRYPDAVHKIHGRMGEALLERGEGREAWRHLLSAAFGLPEDGMVNLNLGRYYEREGRLRRAFSRFVQAVIQPESGPKAIEGLKRVQAKLGGERFSVDLVEERIAGKVLSFGTATRYEPEEGETPNRVVLVQFFTNGRFDMAIGGALGNEGLQSHFPREYAAFLSYHLPSPAPEPLVNELAMQTARALRVRGPFVHVVDGWRQLPGAGEARDKEDIFNEIRRAVEDELLLPSEYAIEVEAKVENGVVRGAVRVSGPSEEDVELHVILAERGVLFPGESKVVIHRMLARAHLTRSSLGAAWQPVDGKMEIPFERALADVTRENEAFLDRLEQQGAGEILRLSTEIDPGQVTIVAFARDSVSGRVLQAAQADAEAPEEEK